MSNLDATILYEQLAQVVDSGDLVTLSTVIRSQSESRSRKDVLADALAVCIEKHCHEAALHLLVQEKADLDLPSKSKQSKHRYPPLILAVRCFHSKDGQSAGSHSQDAQNSAQPGSNHTSDRTRLISLLLQHGASLTAPGPDGGNVLSYIKSNDIVELLLAARTVPQFQEALTQKDAYGNDALMSAIVQDCDTSVSLSYIAQGANIRTVDKLDRTTLMNASWRGRVDVVEKILQQDKGIAKMKDKRGRNIWHHVATDEDRIRDGRLINLLLTIDESDASVNETDAQEHTSLHKCSIFGTPTVAKALLESKRAIVDVAEPNENKTPLHFAAAYGDSAMVQILIDHGADRLAFCNGNLIPLHLACGCEKDDVDAVKILLAENAETQLNARTEDNMTPLHIAADHGHIGIVKILLATPGLADVNAQSQGGWTALHLACGKAANLPSDPKKEKDAEKLKAEAEAQEQNYLAVVQALLSAGSKVNKRSQTARTALHLAAEFGHVGIVKLLLAQKDVQFAAKDSSGNTPLLDAAKSKQRKEILPLLAPWTVQSIDALPENIKQSAQDFDANVIDFFNAPTARPKRHKIPVFDLLYREFSEPGAISRNHVSTRPAPSNKGGFRWIHLPANNLHWCHTLLTKHFIEGGFSDVDGFKDLERSLSQQQYRGKKMHSQYMRPICVATPRQPEAQAHGYTNASCDAYDGRLGPLGRVNSLEIPEPETAPPDPKDYTSPTDEDRTGFQHPEVGLQENGGMPNRQAAQLRSRSRHRATTGQTSEGSGRGDHFPSNTATKPQSDSDNTHDDSFRASLFMPYFALESRQSVRTMHEQLSSGPSKTVAKPVGLSGSPTVADHSEDRDVRLHKAYSDWTANDHGLHIRRTLDQFWYRNVDTRQRDDDQVVLRYQQKENRDAQPPKLPNDNVDVLMVDQLWVWVLGPELIVTSFPQKWQQSRKELPDLLSSVLERLEPRTGDPIQGIYGLAACIVGQCMSTCDRTMYQSHKASVLDMFSGSVGNAMNEEVNLFSRFEKASRIASDWVKQTLLNNSMEDPRERQNFEGAYDEALGSPVSPKDKKKKSHGTNDEPRFVEDLLDIQHETKLLKEIKDIQDELGILSQVTKDQKTVHKNILAAFDQALRPGSNPSDQQKFASTLGEQHILLEQQETEITNMLEQVHIVYKSITDLLDHKQKHANAIEARYARKQASDTAKAGLTLMVFTTVTVIFLPLSFLAAFFAINIKELPHDGDAQQMSLAFIMRNVIGVGLGTALAFVLVAWHHHRVVPLGRQVGLWLSQKALFILDHMRKVTQTIASWFSGESKVGRIRGTKSPMLAMGIVADRDLEHRGWKGMAEPDEEKGMNGSL